MKYVVYSDERAFVSSASPERVYLGYDDARSTIVVGGAYDSVEVTIQDFLARYGITTEDCLRALSGSGK